MIQKKETALITGASSGLGLEYAKIFAREGYDLVVVARNEGKLYALKNELEQAYGCTVHVCAQDLSVIDAAQEVFDFTLEQGVSVDVLVNNAGFGDFGDFATCDWAKQFNMVQVNIVAMMQLTELFVGPMIARGHGRILNMSSVASFSAGPKMSVYYASKEYVRCFSEAIADELKGTGVTVTALCPGPTSTGFEKAAAMKGSRMFAFKPATAADVAEAGYNALMKGKVLRYYGAFTNLANIGARLVPRSVSRSFARWING